MENLQPNCNLLVQKEKISYFTQVEESKKNTKKTFVLKCMCSKPQLKSKCPKMCIKSDEMYITVWAIRITRYY